MPKKKKKTEFLTVKEFITKLQKFDPKMPVTISDGYRSLSYMGLFEFSEFEGTVDVGVGGMGIE